MGSMEHHFSSSTVRIRHGIGIYPVEIAKIGNTMIQQRMVLGAGIFRHGHTPQVPSGYVKIAIENGDLVRGFTH